jgi:hypothetical protein
MAGSVEIEKRKGLSPWRIAGWGGAIALLLVPLVAMQFTGEVDWDVVDFAVMGALIGSVGLAFEIIARKSRNIVYRVGAAVALVAIFLLIWVNLAVGFLGDEGNPANLMFVGVIGVAIIGAISAKLRPAGMARAMFAAAGAQALAGAIGLGMGLGSPGAAGIFEVVMGTTLFGGLWLFSAWLFGNAARGPHPPRPPR